jgi:hypothetical protein
MLGLIIIKTKIVIEFKNRFRFKLYWKPGSYKFTESIDRLKKIKKINIESSVTIKF